MRGSLMSIYKRRSMYFAECGADRHGMLPGLKSK